MAEYFEARRFMEAPRGRKEETLTAKQLSQHLDAFYDIKLSDDFVRSLTANENCKALSDGDIKEVMKIASFWKNCFLDEDEAYLKLVMGLIRSMVRIHCCVVNTNPATNAYVGKYGEINPDSRPFRESFVVTTSLTLRGKAAFVQSPGHYSFAD